MTVLPLKANGPARLAAIAALAAVYFLAARFGLSLGVTEQVTVIWPPTGIALAALLTFETSLWPGIWVGALVANLAASEPLGTALGIATGNTLEALAGVWLLRRMGFDNSVERLRDVLALVLLAVPLATALAATIGVTSLCLGSVQPWSRFGALWWVWWLGDAMGALLVAPVLSSWYRWRPAKWRSAHVAEYLCLLGGLGLASHLTFGQPRVEPPHLHPYAYVVFPFVIWAALRFEQRGTSLAVLVSMVMATWATVRDLGPLGSAQAGESLVYLQAYMGVVAATGLTLGAAISERNRAERHRSVGHAVASVLNEVESLGEAAPRIMSAICECLDFDVGALWTVDRGAHVLRCFELWHQPETSIPEFAAISRERTFAPGIGLPGRVWSSARPAWIEDVVKDTNFPRAAVAAREKLHGAFGFPILLEGEVRGVLEFFSREIRQPDDHLLQLLGAIGSQIGQYMQRRQAEEAVRTSEARKAGVLASVLDAIVTIDHQGRLIEFNAGAELTFGLAAAEVLGKDMAELIIPEQLRERYRVGLERYLRTGQPGLLDQRIEMPAIRADGTEFPVELTIRRVIGSQPPMFTGYLRDITDRNRIEKERERLLKGERRARDRAEALAEDLREQQEAKDMFLAMLGHELRNPLAPVRNGLEILRHRGGSEEARHLYEMMGRQVAHMGRLLDDLLDISRIQRGTIAVQREPVELVGLVTNAVEANRTKLDERQHRLTVALPDGPLWLQGDPTRLEQIVSNLLTNAARYTPPGGDIAVILQRDGDTALLRVRDNGIGIRPEVLPRIFEAFRQADRVAGNVQDGLGLGLTLVRKLAELHGGTVQALSEGPGRGSEFSVRLPLCASEAPRVERQVPESLPRKPLGAGTGASRRILVVDDNKDSAMTLAMLLSIEGHATEVAYDGFEALERFRSFRPDSVFVDIGLPGGMDGHALGERILQECGPNAPVLVAVTGYGSPEDRQRSRSVGFDHHLVKPVDPQELARIMRESGA